MPIVCDTEAVRPSERFDYWQNVVCKQYVTAASTNKSSGPFNARLTSVELGQFGSGALAAPPHCWSRDARQIRSDGRDDFLLSMVVAGQGGLTQGDRTVRQMPGELVLYDTRRPFNYELTDHTIVFKLPRGTLVSHAAISESLYATILGEGTPLRSLLGEALKHCATAPAGPAGAHLGTSIFNLLLALIDLKCGDNAGLTSASGVAQVERVKRYVVANLGDPTLSCDKMAAQAGVSIRTLNRLFGALGTTPMRWVWQRRLEASRRDLLEGHARTVTDAALRAGFNELSHFSRSFKAAYGVSPQLLLRDARRRHS